MSVRRRIAVALSLFACAAIRHAGAVESSAVGEGIYLRGIVGSAAPVEAVREPGGAIRGADAACVNCHRHSGLGSSEGTPTIPPITGRYLYQPRTLQRGQAGLTYVASARANRDPYTDATLARAIRQGLDSEGRPLGYLMPRFKLNGADMAALIGYLKSLDAPQVPGVTDATLHFATIITPDADPEARRGMLDVLNHYFADKNTFPFPPSPRMRSSGKTLYAKSMYMANRRWQLHVWDLVGPAQSWNAQLERHLAQEPVLAEVSGLGGPHWAPVHEFCQHQHLPCLFPNVEVPVIAEDDFYSLYFSKGVLLEADLIAKRISQSRTTIKTVGQLYRAGDSGEPAAHALAAALQGQDVEVRSEVLPRHPSGRDVAEAANRMTADALVLWLRPDDLAALGDPPSASVTVFSSGLMGGLEASPLPSNWRGTRVAYPFDLPDNSRVRVGVPLQWFAIRRIAVVAQRVQVDTYLAAGLLAETVNHLSDTVSREYLVEQMEEGMEHRVMTAHYPRLALAEGQRFASKGGYLVRFDGPQGTLVHADGGWVIP